MRTPRRIRRVLLAAALALTTTVGTGSIGAKRCATSRSPPGFAATRGDSRARYFVHRPRAFLAISPYGDTLTRSVELEGVALVQAREIEVKFRLSDLAGLETAVAARGLVLSAPVRQDDQAYAPDGWSYGMSKQGVAFARLRTQDGRHLFTLKRPTDNEMACLEFETEVADRGQMHEAILHMGFHPTVRIVKTRRTARLSELTLCLDEVEHLGAYLEIERVIQPGQSGAAVQAELDAFARTLGVDLERTTDTYDSLVRAAMATV